jgi:hypothetical protein
MEDTAGVGVAQPGLPAVGAGQPAEQVIEAAILHHHDHDVLDARQLGQRQQIEQAGVAALPAQQQRATGGGRRALEESSSRRSLFHGQNSLGGRRPPRPAGGPAPNAEITGVRPRHSATPPGDAVG